MTDSDLLHHQQVWQWFTQLMKWTIIGVVVLLIFLDLLLVKQW